MRREDAEKIIDGLLSERGTAALDHVERCYKIYGRHLIHSCPLNSRAMCDYADVLAPLEEEITGLPPE